MVVWIIVFVLVLLLACKPQNKSLFTFIFGLLYALVALRHPSMGMMDTEYVYIPAFNAMINQDWEWVVETHKGKDLVFYICTHLFQFISSDKQLYVAVCALPFFIPTYILIKKYSCNYAVSLVLFLSVNFYAMSFTGIRHCIALGFVTFAFICYKEGKLKHSMTFSLSSILFHISALSIVLIWILGLFKYRVRYFFVSLFLGLLCSFVFVSQIRNSLISNVLMSMDRFDQYDMYYLQDNSLNFSLAILLTILMAICILYYRKINIVYSNNNLDVDYWMITVAVLCSFLLIIMGEFLRVTSFFAIPFMVIVPRALFRKKTESFIFIILGCWYFIFRQAYHSGISEYKFFF